MKKINPGQSGFTLIEVVIASAVLAIGILGLWTLHVSMIRSNHRAYTMSQATALTAGQIESLRQELYVSPLLSAGTHNSVDNETGYTVNWTVINNNPVPNAKLLIVSVNVPNNGPTVDFRYARFDDDP